MDFADKIREERQRQKLSYKSLAEKTEGKVSWRTIYMVEAKKVSPSISTLEIIADGLGFNAAHFMGE